MDRLTLGRDVTALVQRIVRILTLRLDQVHSSRLFGDIILPSSTFCSELNEFLVTSSTSIAMSVASVGISARAAFPVSSLGQRRPIFRLLVRLSIFPSPGRWLQRLFEKSRIL